MKSKVKKLSLASDKRILIASDIHGGGHILKKLLERASFCSDDYLFILGDLIERGPNSLQTIRYVMELVERGNTFVLKGNNDTILEEISNNTLNLELYDFIIQRGSIYTEFCEELNLKIANQQDLINSNRIIYEKYKKEIDFVNNLPHIIETDRLLFAHAGIDNLESLEDNDPWRVMRQDTFANTSECSTKLLFVGHYPCVVYAYKNADYSPKRNFKKRIISIDGGYAVKDEGHINLLIMDSENNINIDFIFDDDLPIVEVVDNQAGNTDYDLVVWNREELEVIEIKDDYSICIINKEKRINIPNIFLYQSNGKWYCMDYTNRLLSLDKNDKVKLVKTYKDMCLVKDGTTVGWIKKDKLKL